MHFYRKVSSNDSVIGIDIFMWLFNYTTPAEIKKLLFNTMHLLSRMMKTLNLCDAYFVSLYQVFSLMIGIEMQLE